MKKTGSTNHNSSYSVDGGLCSVEYRNGIYHGELSFRQKCGLGAFYWDSGEYYFGRLDVMEVNGARIR